MKFKKGTGQRFAIVPYKVRLYFASEKAPSVAREVYYSLTQLLFGDADEFREIPQTRLAAELCVSVRQVERGIAWLRDHELVTVRKRSGFAHRYYLNEWPKALQGSDRDVMKRTGICPCKWSARCPLPPPKLPERLWV